MIIYDSLDVWDDAKTVKLIVYYWEAFNDNAKEGGLKIKSVELQATCTEKDPMKISEFIIVTFKIPWVVKASKLLLKIYAEIIFPAATFLINEILLFVSISILTKVV